MTTVSDRKPRSGVTAAEHETIIEAAIEGKTFAEIGRMHGVSRERIRQIVNKHTADGGAAAFADARKAAAHAVAVKAAQEAQAKVRTYVDAHPDATVPDILEHTGVAYADVSAELTPTEMLIRTSDKRDLPKASDETVLAVMQAVAALPFGNPLTTTFYDENYKDIAPDAVSSVRILQRFGTWREACQQAGVKMHAAPRKHYVRTWDEPALLEWVNVYLATTDKPTYAGLDTWLQEQRILTQKKVPSAQTMRNRFGMWRDIVKAAVAIGESSGESHLEASTDVTASDTDAL